MENEFLIRFGGSNNIRVETLTDFLLSYRELLYSINNGLGYSPDDLIVEVSPPIEGSFKIKINPKYKNVLIGSVCTLLTGTLSGLLVVWISNTNKNLSIEDVEKILKYQKRDKVEITNIYNVYQSPDIRQALRKSFIAVSNDENIDSLDITKDDVSIISVPKADFTKYVCEECDSNIILKEPVKSFDVEATIIIKTVHFEGEAKWGFIWNGSPIKANIKDEKFLERLNNESFKRGDRLKVRLKKKTVFNNELDTYVVDERGYEILEVLDHASKNDDRTLTISMNE